MGNDLNILKASLSTMLNQFGKDSVEQLRAEHLAAGQKASGRTLSEFAYDLTESETSLKLEIKGADHIEFLDRGRGPGGIPANITDIIKQWARDKGIASQFDKEYKLNSFAYLVARKIAAEGTWQHRTGRTYNGATRPVMAAFNEARIKALQDEIDSALSITINSEILKEFKNGNNN